MYSNLANTFDALLQLKDAGAVAANNTAGTVGGSARVVDIGDAFAAMSFHVKLGTMDTAGGDEAYQIILQGSDSSTFASGVVNLAIVHAGLAAVNGQPANVLSGLISVPVQNSLDGKNTVRYLRAYLKTVGATVSLDYTAWLTRDPR